jgi:hypothetical protein
LGKPLVVFCGHRNEIESIPVSFQDFDQSEKSNQEDNKAFELLEKSEVGSVSLAIYTQNNVDFSSFAN